MYPHPLSGRRPRSRAAIAVIVAAGLTLAACGDDETTDTTLETLAGDESAEVTETETETGTETGDETEGDKIEATASENIVEVAVATDWLSTLVAALQAADLVGTLEGPGPFTVFAPDDDAFAALPEGVLDALLLPENRDILVEVLTYHVLPASVFAEEVTDGEAATVQGDTVTLSTAGGVTVNGAAVKVPDVLASNGVIHVIDTVLLPPGIDIDALVAG